MKTDYEVNYTDKGIEVLKDGKLQAKGFTDDESALHAIYVLEGKIQDHFYVVDEKGVVSCIDRGEL